MGYWHFYEREVGERSYPRYYSTGILYERPLGRSLFGVRGRRTSFSNVFRDQRRFRAVMDIGIGSLESADTRWNAAQIFHDASSYCLSSGRLRSVLERSGRHGKAEPVLLSMPFGLVRHPLRRHWVHHDSRRALYSSQMDPNVGRLV